VFVQTDLGLAHQTEHGQQLRLSKLPLAELRPLRRQDRLADFHSQTGKSHQSNLGHLHFAKAPEHLQLNFISATLRTDVSRMSTEPVQVKLNERSGICRRLVEFPLRLPGWFCRRH